MKQVFYILNLNILIRNIFEELILLFLRSESHGAFYVGFFFFLSFPFLKLCSLEFFGIYLRIFVHLSFSASHLEALLPRITLNSQLLVIGNQDGCIQM